MKKDWFVIDIDNNLYNKNIDWNMFWANWLNEISQKEFFLYFLDSLKQKNYNLNLYIHWFFCKSECIYCPYLKIIWKIDHERIKNNLIKIKKDLQVFIDFLEDQWIDSKQIKIETVSFWWWTPSYVPYKYLEEISLFLKKNFTFNPKEWTIEINPTPEDYDNIRQLRKLWLNRISIWIQTFNKEITIKTWRWLKNIEVDKIIKQAYEDFWNINLDMIYWLPWQTESTLKEDLEIINNLSWYINHLSYYPLYIFPWTILQQNIKQYKDTIYFWDNKINWYNYNKIINFWNIIYNKLNKNYEFYTMDYLRNKEIGKKHLYQINYLNNKPLLALGYWYGWTDLTFINNHKYYLYKNFKHIFFKDILLSIRLMWLNEWLRKIYNKIPDILNILFKDIKKKKQFLFIINFLSRNKCQEHYKYQYYLQSLFLDLIKK